MKQDFKMNFDEGDLKIVYLQRLSVGLVLVVLAGCSLGSAASQPSSAAPASSAIFSTPSPIAWSMDELRLIIDASNPQSRQYDPTSARYAEFPDAVRQLAGMGPQAVDAAGDLAMALTFPRSETYLAAQALLALGPDITSTTIVSLFANLDASNPNKLKPEALIYSAILLGSTGNRASCAVGNIGPRLWNPDAQVRSAAAFALEQITGLDLVATRYEIEITPSFLAGSISPDNPEGKITTKARKWWQEKGSKVRWHASYGYCDP